MVWEKAVKDSVGTLEYYNRNKNNYPKGETANATIVMTNDTAVLNEIVNNLGKSYYPVERKVFAFKMPLASGSWLVIDSLYDRSVSRPDLQVLVAGNNTNIAGFKTAAVKRQQYNKPEFVYLTDNSSDSLSFQVVTSSKKRLVDLYSGIPGLILRIDTGTYEKGTNNILNLVNWKKGAYYLSLEDSEYYVVIHKINAPEPKSLDEARGAVVADYQKFLETAWINELRKKYPVKINKKVLREIYHKLEN